MLIRAMSAQNYQAAFMGPFLYPLKDKDEDRIVGGIIADQWPFVIIADGVSSEADSAQTAQIAVETAQAYLDYYLPAVANIEEMMAMIDQAYWAVAENLSETTGATTLLIACLWGRSADELYWFYGYVGNGYINIISPARKIALRSRLLTPQAVGATACFNGGQLKIAPQIGCVRHCQNDILYAASDGLIKADAYLRRHSVLASSFESFIIKNLDSPEVIEAELKLCPYEDDAALGIIWTENKES